MTGPTAETIGVDEEATVLVVDDERGLADLYTIWLRDCYDVRTTYDAENALDSLDVDVDVVLLDRQMPGVSGDDVLETIREHDFDCRVAMVTAVEPKLDIVDLGFDDYLRKPVDRETLRDSVDRLLRRSAYDSTVQRYFGAVRKRALLVDGDGAAATDSTKFEQLEADISELRGRLDGVLADFDDEDYDVLFKRLSPPEQDYDGS